MTIWNPSENGDDGFADLSSYDTFTKGAPHNTFKRLRDEDPLAWCECQDHEGFWSVTRFEDIETLNKNFKTFSSARGIRMEDQTYEEYLARRTFQETDPPEHTRTRLLVSKAFSKPVIAQYEELIKKLCVEILDDVLPKVEFDATTEIARILPMRMLGRIIGVPDEDLPWLVEKGDELISNTDPEFANVVLGRDDTDAYKLLPFRSPAGAELADYAEKLMTEKKKSGDDSGVLNMVLKENSKGEVISKQEFRNFFCLLVAAGNDTTRFSIAASIHALTQQKELLGQLKSGENDIWETAPDEFIRWASPTLYFRRTATTDFDMHGKTIKEGDKVLYWFASANRDDRVFEEPFKINLYRSPNRHMAFGQGGPHVCLGMWLARLEIRAIMQELTKRISGIELNGDIEYVRSNFVNGIKRMPVKITV